MLQLSTRAATHITKHRDQYEPAWDGVLLPDGTKDKTHENYLLSIGQLRSFASELEIRALARICKIERLPRMFGRHTLILKSKTLKPKP